MECTTPCEEIGDINISGDISASPETQGSNYW